jgi:hypothetical protein
VNPHHDGLQGADVWSLHEFLLTKSLSFLYMGEYEKIALLLFLAIPTIQILLYSDTKR